jgi:hypothetical protein
VATGRAELHVLRCTGKNVMFGFRTLHPDPQRAKALVEREIVDERDRFYLAMLRQLGIEPGKPFARMSVCARSCRTRRLPVS